MGDILFRESKFNEAERAYSTAVQVDPHCARGYWGLGRLEILTSHREAAHDHIAKAFQLNPREPDIVLSFADFVQDPSARITLLRNFLALANGNSEDRARRGDVAARLEITERLGHVDLARLASPYRPYRIKLAGYFPNGHTQSGLLIQVSLNGGRRLQLILDSGADGIFVNAASARAAKVEPLIAERVDDVGSAADSNAYVALAHHVTMGSLELEDCLVHVTDTSAFPTADGVIGMNVFEKFLVRVDPASLTVELEPLMDRPNVNSAAPNMVHAYRVDHFLLVDGVIEGQRDQYFLLDTGASFSSTPGASDKAVPGGAGIDVRGVDGRVRGALRGQPMRLTVEGRQLVDKSSVKLDLTELSQHEGVEISGIIGYPLLGRSVLTIDYRDGLVQFGEPNR